MNEERPLAEKVKSSLLLLDIFWAIIFGLLISNTIGFPEKLKAGLKIEAFINKDRGCQLF